MFISMFKDRFVSIARGIT